MSEEIAGSHWLRRTSIDGGWVVLCRLCGKPSKRSFMASLTNHAIAEKDSRAYAHEHIATAGHQAAMRAFQTNKDVGPTEEEMLLAKIFNLPEPTPAAARKRSARMAARIAERRERSERERQRHEALRESQPQCAICDLPVSMKDERAEDRIELPSGALIHAKCVPQ